MNYVLEFLPRFKQIFSELQTCEGRLKNKVEETLQKARLRNYDQNSHKNKQKGSGFTKAKPKVQCIT